MNEHFTSGVVSLVLLILYLVIKDITIPLLRRRQNSHHSSNNPSGVSVGARDIELREKFAGFQAKVDQQWKAQEETNERIEGNIRRIFERLDKERI